MGLMMVCRIWPLSLFSWISYVICRWRSSMMVTWGMVRRKSSRGRRGLWCCRCSRSRVWRGRCWSCMLCSLTIQLNTISFVLYFILFFHILMSILGQFWSLVAFLEFLYISSSILLNILISYLFLTYNGSQSSQMKLLGGLRGRI